MRVKPKLSESRINTLKILTSPEGSKDYLCASYGSKCPEGLYYSQCDKCIFDAPIEEFKTYLKEQLDETNETVV